MESVIKTSGLTKFYGKHLALESLNLNIVAGEIFGFLGPNGAGKTTFIKLLLGFIRPSTGIMQIMGDSLKNLDRSSIGYLPEKIVIQSFLTGREYLQYQGQLNNIHKTELKAQINSALERLEMTEAADRRIADYSKGMVQRIGIANLLLGKRKLLLLDEPNSGMDPIGIALIRKLLLELKSEGKTIFINSHQLLEVEKICDRVAILNQGRVVAEGKQSELSSKQGIHLELAELTENHKNLFKKLDSDVIIQGNHAELIIENSEKERLLPAQIVEAGGRILSYSQRNESLEDVFQRLIETSNN